MTPKIAFLAAAHETQNGLRAWALAHRFDLTRTHGGRAIADDQFDFHVTLLATKNAISAPAADMRVAAVELAATGFDALGAGDVPVLKIEASEVLVVARKFFVALFGAVPTYEDFKPHISLSYNWTGTPELKSLELPGFPLVFDRLIVREFEPSQKAAILPIERKRVGAQLIYG